MNYPLLITILVLSFISIVFYYTILKEHKEIYKMLNSINYYKNSHSTFRLTNPWLIENKISFVSFIFKLFFTPLSVTPIYSNKKEGILLGVILWYKDRKNKTILFKDVVYNTSNYHRIKHTFGNFVNTLLQLQYVGYSGQIEVNSIPAVEDILDNLNFSQNEGLSLVGNLLENNYKNIYVIYGR